MGFNSGFKGLISQNTPTLATSGT